MIQKHCWNYFTFNQSYLAKGKKNTKFMRNVHIINFFVGFACIGYAF